MLDKLRELRKIAFKNGNPILRDKSFELLIDLVRHKSPKTILEVGTNVGLSGIAMLLACKDCTLTGIEIDENTAKEAQKNYRDFNVDNRAKIFLGDAGEIIGHLTGKYDFIFLDGPKGHYYEYVQDLTDSLSVGGILFADNVLFRGYVDGKVKTPHRYATTKNSMTKFLSFVSNSEKFKTEVIDIEDGISITEKLK